MPTTAPVHTERLRHFERVCEILDRHDRDPMKLIPVLQEVQAEYRYLPEEVMAFVATSLGLPPAQVFGVATFYSHFAIAPKGKHIILLCDGTACHVKKSMDLLDALRKRLGLTDGCTTTPDFLFTVETVSCLGACGLAPVVCVDGEMHGQMTPAKAVALVEAIVADEETA